MQASIFSKTIDSGVGVKEKKEYSRMEMEISKRWRRFNYTAQLSKRSIPRGKGNLSKTQLWNPYFEVRPGRVHLTKNHPLPHLLWGRFFQRLLSRRRKERSHAHAKESWRPRAQEHHPRPTRDQIRAPIPPPPQPPALKSTQSLANPAWFALPISRSIPSPPGGRSSSLPPDLSVARAVSIWWWKGGEAGWARG